MFTFRMILRNAFRHKLRMMLTMIGLVVAIIAFGLLRTIVEAWYAGAEGTSSARLVTRNAVSLVFPLPLNYAQRIRTVPGVSSISWANWFGGIYVTERNFFPQFAIDPESYLAMYPEFRLPDAERKAFFLDRQGCIAGRKIADQFGWKVGDTISLRGTIYPGTWTFNLRGIYDGADAKTDTSQMFFHWKLINESVRRMYSRSTDFVGVYVVELKDPALASEVSLAVDSLFRNSNAETLTETEKAFQLSFVAMTEAILVAIQAVSVVIVLIIMAVMANTIAMTARERISEYATLKALGFSSRFVSGMIVAESLLVALAGGLLGVAMTFPIAATFARAVGTLFPVFIVSGETVALQLASALVVGLVAAMVPSWRMARINIIDGLRHVG